MTFAVTALYMCVGVLGKGEGDQEVLCHESSQERQSAEVQHCGYGND